METNSVRYLPHRQIAKEKWDDLIARACNHRPYAYSWYLDTVSPGWDALVTPDYRMVFPLPYSRKLGFSYLRQPRFTQQLGLFSVKTPDLQDTEAFWAAIPSKFVLCDLNMHGSMPLLTHQHQYAAARPNYLLHLLPSYQSLYSQYSTNTRRNIKKARKAQLRIMKTRDIQNFITLKRNNTQNLNPEDYHTLSKLLYTAHGKNRVLLYAACNASNRWEAAAAFISSGKRMIMINNGSTPEGKNHRAMFLLLDTFIQQWSGSDLQLDFEGSVLPGVARFFSGFGATPEYYNRVTFYRRHWLQKLAELKADFSLGKTSNKQP